MQKCHVIIGTYNHLPEGVEESAFEERYQVCWRPFLSTLYRFPDISAVLHYSGTVLRWLEVRHPEFFMLLEEMSARKQIELLGGGFFAPLFPLVSGPDRLGQIELLTTFIRKSFGKRPRGSWIQDYAWEPGLASALQTCGFDFTFLQQRQFLMAGAELSGPAVTEDQGKSLVILPVFDALEDFPSPPLPHEAIESIKAHHEELDLITLFYPDIAAAEMWRNSRAETPDLLFETAFAALQRDSLVYETTTPSRLLKVSRRIGRAYFPSSASLMLMRRSLEACPVSNMGQTEFDANLPFIGSPRRFLRDENSAALYAKMQYVRILLSQLRGDKSRKKSAQEELWRGQCGEAYWHGPNGGIRRLPVRAQAYGALIEAEKTTRQRGSFVPGLIRADIDFDGEKEILYQGIDYNAYIHLRGAVLSELDSLRTLTNYVDAFDPSFSLGAPRCFHDRFFEHGSYDRACKTPSGEDFSDGLYAIVDTDKPILMVTLTRENQLYIEGKPRTLHLRKSYSFRKGLLGLDFELINRDASDFSLRFCSELNLTIATKASRIGLNALRGHAREALPADIRTAATGLTGVQMENLAAGEHVVIRSDTEFSLVHEPLFAPLDICGRPATAFQGHRSWIGWDLKLPANGTARFSLSLELGKL